MLSNFPFSPLQSSLKIRDVLSQWILTISYDSHLRVTGGEVGAQAALAPKIGPLGLSPKKIGEDIAKSTGDWVRQFKASSISTLDIVSSLTLSWFSLSKYRKVSGSLSSSSSRIARPRSLLSRPRLLWSSRL
jgi:Ribosomal protein L11, N-terminal domain